MTINRTKKILMQLVFIFALIFIFSTSHKASANVINGFNFKAGDIVITSSTSPAGLTGHAGIVLPDEIHIAHIAGSRYNSDRISISKWLTLYPNTKVVRYAYSLTAMGSAYFAQNYFINGPGKNIDYAITPDLRSRSTMYCSKLVWQCYDGAGVAFNPTPFKNVYGEIRFPVEQTILSPYDFLNSQALTYNNFSIVKSFNW